MDVTFKVDPAEVTLELMELNNITYQDTVKIKVNVTANGKPMTTGNISITINETKYNATVENGLATIEIPGESHGVGIYSSELIFDAGENYTHPKQEVNFKIAQEHATISIGHIQDCTYGGEVIIIVVVTGDITQVREGTAYLTLNNEIYNESLEDGFTRFTLRELDAGSYQATISFDGGINYITDTETASFKVKPIPVNLNLNVKDIEYGDTVKINVEVMDYEKPINTGNVTIYINEVPYSANVTNGSAIIEIPNLNAGKYESEISYDGGKNYNHTNKTASFEVKPASIAIDAKANDVTYGDTVQIDIKASANGNPLNEGKVIVKLNNANYIGTISNGIARILIPNLNAGSYNGELIIDAGENYQATPKSISFNVLKQNTALNAEAKSYVINYAGKYSITLKDINGNALSGQTVTFTLNGKLIGTANTNAEGVATIKISANALKKAKSGKRNLLIQFAGNTNYNAIRKTVQLTIKKEKTKILAKKKTFKRSTKTKKYKVTLKNSKGKAIKKAVLYLKVKGKTYKAKTNKKGKATFKIKKLSKKGKYTVKISFKANKYYLKSSKKAKINIK